VEDTVNTSTIAKKSQSYKRASYRTTDNNKIYEVGQTVIYDSATMHEPYCTIESEYDVTLCYNLNPEK
jgi:hypothetical protein